MKQVTLTRRRPAELDLGRMAEQAMQPWADAYEIWRSGAVDLLERARPAPRARHHDRCECEDCRPDRCACKCCVNDSDLICETHVGERRIITLVIENRWRREREIELELSSWTKTPEGVEVQAELLTPTSLTLAPCGETEVVIAVLIRGANADQREPVDIETCAVSYADLRIKGCDLRSIRLAVAILPRTCGAYRVDCACGCR